MTNDWEFRSGMYNCLIMTWVGALAYWWAAPSDRILFVVGAVLIVAYLLDRTIEGHNPTADSGGPTDQ